MTGLELFFAILGSVLSIIGIITGIIGGKSLYLSNKNKINLEHGEVNIDQSINKGISVNELKKLGKNFSDHFESLFERRNQLDKENIIEIVKKTAAEMKADEKIESPLEDWTLKFFKYSSYGNDDKVRDIWSKLLKMELVNHGSVSLRTMEILSNITHDEAELFEIFSSYVIGGGYAPKDIIDDSKEFSFENILILKECGLVYSDSIMNITSTVEKDKNSNFNNKNYLLLYKTSKNSGDSFSFPIYGLTRAGQELYRILGYSCSDHFFVKIAKYFKKHYSNITFTLHKINFIYEGGINYKLEDIIDKV